MTALGSADTAIRVNSVSAGYGGRQALDDVNLEISRGALVAIFGPNGGGKSTLLKLIAGLIDPWRGSVEVLGAPAGEEAKRVAYVPQAELVDWSFPVSVWDVAMMGRYPRLGPLRRPGRADREAVEAALERVAMADRRGSQIGALSGGQRRRAFLARAIAAAPDLYLLDEPVTGVDVTTQEDLMALLAAETAAGRTAVATTHDLAAAAEHFSTVVALNRHVIATGPSSLILDPEILSQTYGGHLLVLNDRAVVLDDAHHHDTASGGEHHFHEKGDRH
ncbi:MAG TPA: metal ABC transporter ATP-binding protein [Candidatus Limnocylindria bacterium]|nr:metal ABC transporter ATP-binding protein [Candidatus Limnocylindria bacterium]